MRSTPQQAAATIGTRVASVFCIVLAFYGHLEQALRAASLEAVRPSPAGVRSVCGTSLPPPGIDQEAGIGGLVVVHRVGGGHEDGGGAHGGQSRSR